MPSTTDEPLRFGRFEIRPAERALLVDGRSAAVGARAFDLLLALAQRRERMVGKQELLDLVWPGVVVEEHNIAAHISSLRKVLGAQVIATVPGRGYQFVAKPDAASPARTAAGGPLLHNLPEQRTRFIGREAALADLARLVPQSRLVTLTGIGGSGKTRLALQVARQQLAEFADGVWFIDLAPLRESERVAGACAAALGLDKVPEGELAQRLAAHVAEREALIVLDNCEHVRDGVAALVDALLSRAGRSRIVATSREALAVAGEQLYRVPPLSLPAASDANALLEADSVRVFVDRARLVLPEFEVTDDNAAAIGEICRRLDGIALAIELAAARVTMLSVFDIAARLEDRFRLLTGGNPSVVRQQTLLATMEWSYEHLSNTEQRVLRHAATFAGGWTLDAATAVAQVTDEYETLSLLAALHDKSLLAVEHGASGDIGHGGSARPRYRMLETVRQYAQQRLDESGEASAARTRHAEHFLALAESAAPHLRGRDQPQWMARLREEQENLVAAMTWCVQADSPIDPQWGLRLAVATSRYWIFNEIELGFRLATAALQRDRDGADSEARFHTLHGLAAMTMHRGDAQTSLAHARTALAMARRHASAEWQMKALAAIASALSTLGESDAALPYDREALELAEASGNAEYVATLSNNIAEIERGCDELESAERGYRKALSLGRAQGNFLLTAIVLHNLARVMLTAGRHDEAHAYAVESEHLLRSIGEKVLKFELLKVVAGLAVARGDHALAARFWGASQPRFINAGYRDPKIDETQYAQQMAEARRALGDAAFEAAEAAGRTLDLDSAMLELRHWLSQGA